MNLKFHPSCMGNISPTQLEWEGAWDELAEGVAIFLVLPQCHGSQADVREHLWKSVHMGSTYEELLPPCLWLSSAWAMFLSPSGLRESALHASISLGRYP